MTPEHSDDWSKRFNQPAAWFDYTRYLGAIPVLTNSPCPSCSAPRTAFIFSEVIDRYILDSDGHPLKEPDLLTWGLWLEHSHKSKGKDNRIVQQDQVGEVHISTVFLGLDHRWPVEDRETKPPILWETMIFGGTLDSYQRRYESLDEAIVGHMQAVEKVKGLRFSDTGVSR